MLLFSIIIFYHDCKTHQNHSYIARWYPAANCCVCPLALMVYGPRCWPSAFDLWYHSHCRDSPIWRSLKSVSFSDGPILTRCGFAPSRSSRKCSLLSLARTWSDRSRFVHWMWLRFCCQLFVKVECSADSLCVNVKCKVSKNICINTRAARRVFTWIFQKCCNHPRQWKTCPEWVSDRRLLLVEYFCHHKYVIEKENLSLMYADSFTLV